jgi:uncharacterized protein
MSTMVTILSVSDEVVPKIYHTGLKEQFSHIDLVLGCGDLPPSYLEYIVSSLDKPLFYVPGNHDGTPEVTEHGAILNDPAGAINIDRRVIRHDGLILAGLGGSIWYNGGKNQYTQTVMTARVYSLLPRLLWHRRRNGYGLDVLITHAPPLGIHDGSGPHTGFKAVRWLIERFPPRYHFHGHIHHNYRMNKHTVTQHGGTLIINTSGYRLTEIEVLAAARRGRYNPAGE